MDMKFREPAITMRHRYDDGTQSDEFPVTLSGDAEIEVPANVTSFDVCVQYDDDEPIAVMSFHIR